MPLRIASVERFCTKVEMLASHPSRKMIVQSVSVGPAEELKPVILLYILIEAEAENKTDLLRVGQVYGIGVGNHKGGI